MEEIERKFLVKNESFKKEALRTHNIVQGFLNTDPERTVRIRKRDDRASIAVKGLSSEDGLVRFEWEHEISQDEADLLLRLCEHHLIEKTRYLVKYKGLILEIDVFHGHNKGLIIAEIELLNRDQEFTKPDWLAKEVTGDIKYYNSFLSKNPFNSWSD